MKKTALLAFLCLAALVPSAPVRAAFVLLPDGEKGLDKAVTEAYDLYKQGQEMAVDGTPLRACLAFGPAQIAAAENVKIFSLEALAQASETEIAAIGMGGRDMKTKAEKMLQNLADSRVAEENAALRLQLSDQGTMITELRKQIENLTFLVESQRRGSAEPQREMEESRRGPGRPPKSA